MFHNLADGDATITARRRALDCYGGAQRADHLGFDHPTLSPLCCPTLCARLTNGWGDRDLSFVDTAHESEGEGYRLLSIPRWLRNTGSLVGVWTLSCQYSGSYGASRALAGSRRVHCGDFRIGDRSQLSVHRICLARGLAMVDDWLCTGVGVR